MVGNLSTWGWYYWRLNSPRHPSQPHPSQFSLSPKSFPAEHPFRHLVFLLPDSHKNADKNPNNNYQFYLGGEDAKIKKNKQKGSDWNGKIKCKSFSSWDRRAVGYLCSVYRLGSGIRLGHRIGHGSFVALYRLQCVIRGWYHWWNLGIYWWCDSRSDHCLGL